jgi:hypothetical protein
MRSPPVVALVTLGGLAALAGCARPAGSRPSPATARVFATPAEALGCAEDALATVGFLATPGPRSAKEVGALAAVEDSTGFTARKITPGSGSTPDVSDYVMVSAARRDPSGVVLRVDARTLGPGSTEAPLPSPEAVRARTAVARRCGPITGR